MWISGDDPGFANPLVHGWWRLCVRVCVCVSESWEMTSWQKPKSAWKLLPELSTMADNCNNTFDDPVCVCVCVWLWVCVCVCVCVCVSVVLSLPITMQHLSLLLPHTDQHRSWLIFLCSDLFFWFNYLRAVAYEGITWYVCFYILFFFFSFLTFYKDETSRNEKWELECIDYFMIGLHRVFRNVLSIMLKKTPKAWIFRACSQSEQKFHHS